MIEMVGSLQQRLEQFPGFFRSSIKPLAMAGRRQRGQRELHPRAGTGLVQDVLPLILKDQSERTTNQRSKRCQLAVVLLLTDRHRLLND